MSQSPETIIKTVEIAVPSEVEQRARDRAGDGGELELYLLDEVELEFEWVFESVSEDSKN